MSLNQELATLYARETRLLKLQRVQREAYELTSHELQEVRRRMQNLRTDMMINTWFNSRA